MSKVTWQRTASLPHTSARSPYISKVPLPVGNLDRKPKQGFFGPRELSPKLCLDRFSRFCTADPRAHSTLPLRIRHVMDTAATAVTCYDL